MKKLKGTVGLLVLFVLLSIILGACGSRGGDEMSWQEEALLHDGSKIIVKRSVWRGGRHEVGQQPPIRKQSLTITMPITNERIVWKSDFSKDVGLADFAPVSIDIVQGTVYVVSDPVGCLSYNKWGRPNPPYVIFQYDGKKWQQITLEELPAEIKEPNLIISSPDNEVERLGKKNVTADEVKEFNSDLKQPEYKTILREPLPKKRINHMCMELVYYKGAWIEPGDSIGRRMMDRKSN